MPDAPIVIFAPPTLSPVAPSAVFSTPIAGGAAVANLAYNYGADLCATITAKLLGAAGNGISIQFVGTRDPSNSGPYGPGRVTSVVVTGNAIVVNWYSTQSGLRPSVVQAALAASAPANALVSLTVGLDTASTPWSSGVVGLSGGGVLGAPSSAFIPPTPFPTPSDGIFGLPSLVRSNPSAVFSSPVLSPTAPGAIYTKP